MRRSLADHSGYLVIDHRDSPGLSPADVAGVPGAIAVPGGDMLERDVQQCSHCQRAVVLNPGRVRTRAVCPRCQHYICDTCESARVTSGGACVPFQAVLDRAQNIAEKFIGQPDHPDAAIDVDRLQAPSAPIIHVTDHR